MLIFQRRDDSLIAGWLTYEASGRPTWFFTTPGRWTTANVYEAGLYATSNGPYFGAEESARFPQVRKVGSILFNFGGDGVPAGDVIVRSGRIAYSVDGISSTRVIQSSTE